MAVPVEIVATDARTYVTSTSRYANSQVMLYGEDRLATFTTYKRTRIGTSDQDRYMVVPPGEEYRPDLTSYRAFGTVDYWWQIMQANNISDIFDYKAGTNLRIPSPFSSTFLV